MRIVISNLSHVSMHAMYKQSIYHSFDMRRDAVKHDWKLIIDFIVYEFIDDKDIDPHVCIRTKQIFNI